MLSEQSTNLAEGISRLRSAATTAAAPIWLPDALHAMILACLARLFARLEDLILLWQAGQLPAPHTRSNIVRTGAARPHTPRTNRARRRSRPHARTTPPRNRHARAIPHALTVPPRAMATAPPDLPPPHPARGPPPLLRRRTPPRTASHSRA